MSAQIPGFGWLMIVKVNEAYAAWRTFDTGSAPETALVMFEHVHLIGHCVIMFGRADFHHYAVHYSYGPVGHANASIPMLVSWDDHDIYDGFGVGHSHNVMRLISST